LFSLISLLFVLNDLIEKIERRSFSLDIIMLYIFDYLAVCFSAIM
jgi:hypothetical protein